MDITSPTVLKLKSFLFLFLGIFSGALLILPDFSISKLGLLCVSTWAFCRAYYFIFYVLHHYVDSNFNYCGLFDMVRQIFQHKRGNP